MSTLIEGNPALSAGLAHGFLTTRDRFSDIPNDLYPFIARNFPVVASQSRQAVHEYLDSDGVEAPMGQALEVLRQNPVSRERDFPFSRAAFLPNSINAIPNRVFGVGNWVGAQGQATADDLRRILQAGHPAILTVNTDARNQQENWIRMQGNGDMNHVINIVGYGRGADPFDGQTKDYFIVRDSLGTRAGIHYQISAENLVRHMQGIYRITEAQVLSASPTYRDTGTTAR